MAHDLTIEALGGQGDGLAHAPGGDVYVPYTLPGERVRAELAGDRGQVVEVLSRSPDRIAPVCAHFGVCGGCALQHMAGPAYLAWKHDQVVRAFRNRGVEVEVAPVVAVARPASRRRTVLAARRAGGGVLLGFHERGSGRIVDIRECSVLRPRLRALLPGLRELLALLLTRRGEAAVTVIETEAGPDVAVAGGREPEGPRALTALADLVERCDLARLTVDGETIVTRRPPVLRVGKAMVTVPPGGFVQAVADAEAELVSRAEAALQEVGRIADLFAGIGTFTLPLAARAEVTAVERDGAAVAALEAAVRGTGGLKPVQAVRRDLARDPLSRGELARFDAVLFDPPRSGARAQAEQLARSGVPRIVAVSCNPATLARDARTLLDGGYTLDRVEPIDQFVFSPHIEVFASFMR